MKFKIGVFGSSNHPSVELSEKARELGKCFNKNKTILVTGGCSGLPYIAASEASKNGVEIWGYSPTADLEHQKIEFPDDDSSVYTKIIYIPKDYEFSSKLEVTRKYRNVSSTANCDAGIIISGRWGTLNEFTNLYDMGKVIGVLKGTGGISDELEQLDKKIYKPGQAVVLFSDNPKDLLEKIVKELEKRNEISG